MKLTTTTAALALLAVSAPAAAQYGPQAGQPQTAVQPAPGDATAKTTEGKKIKLSKNAQKAVIDRRLSGQGAFLRLGVHKEAAARPHPPRPYLGHCVRIRHPARTRARGKSRERAAARAIVEPNQQVQNAFRPPLPSRLDIVPLEV